MAKIGRPLAMSVDERRKEILNTAEKLFGDQGFESVTMTDIAQASAMSKKTLYVYFSDKKQLLTALLTSPYTFSNDFPVDGKQSEIDILKNALYTIAQHVLSTRHLKLYRLAIAEHYQTEGLSKSFHEMGMVNSRNQLVGLIENIPVSYWQLKLSAGTLSDMLFGANIGKAMMDALLIGEEVNLEDIKQGIHSSVDALFQA